MTTVVATVILLSTRGTAGSDIWFMCLADKPMVRGYHLRDYDWTPLSQNLAQIYNDILCTSALGGNDKCRRTRVSGVGSGTATATDHTHSSVISSGDQNDIHPRQGRSVKSFVDDLVLGRGVVPSRAATTLRSIETKPFD